MSEVNKILIFIVGIIGGVLISAMIFRYVGSFASNKPDEVKQPEASVDTVYIKQKPEVQIERVVEHVDVMNYDTVMLLTNINQNIDSGEYVVLRDRLLHSQHVKIIKTLGNTTESASEQLLERITSDDFYSDRIQVEFWESPIEYQGYRLNKTKLILFGVNPHESFMLHEKEKGILTLQTGYFTTLLFPTEKYRSFNFQ